MNLNIVELFKEKYNRAGDKLIIDQVILTDGHYVRVNNDETTDIMEITHDGKNIEGVDFSNWVKERIIYCEKLDSAGSTVLGTGHGAEIQSANGYSFRIKNESIDKLNNDKITNYFNYFSGNNNTTFTNFILNNIINNIITVKAKNGNIKQQKITHYYFYNTDIDNYVKSYNIYYMMNKYSKSDGTIEKLINLKEKLFKKQNNLLNETDSKKITKVNIEVTKIQQQIKDLEKNRNYIPYWITYNTKKPLLTNNNMFLQNTVLNQDDIDLIHKLFMFLKYASHGKTILYIPTNDFQLISDVSKITVACFKLHIKHTGFPISCELFTQDNIVANLYQNQIVLKNIFKLDNFINSKNTSDIKTNNIDVLNKIIMANFTIDGDFSTINIFTKLDIDSSLLDNFNLSMLNVIKQKVSSEQYFHQCVSVRLSLLHYFNSSNSILQTINKFLISGTENTAFKTLYPKLTNNDINDELYSFVYGKLLADIGEYNYNSIFTTSVNNIKNNIFMLLKDYGYKLKLTKSLKDMLYIIYSYQPTVINVEYILAGFCAKKCYLHFDLKRDNENHLFNKVGKAYQILIQFKNVSDITFDMIMPLISAQSKKEMITIFINTYKIYSSRLEYQYRAYFLQLVNEININKFINSYEQLLLGILK